MFWRLIVVAWLLALSVWGVLHFQPEISAGLHTAWGWDKDKIEKFNTLLEIAEKALAVLAGLGTAVKLVLNFISGKSKESSKITGNTATFNGPVKINDFVQGDKNTTNVNVHSLLGARASRPPKSRPRWPRSQEKAGGNEELPTNTGDKDA